MAFSTLSLTQLSIASRLFSWFSGLCSMGKFGLHQSWLYLFSPGFLGYAAWENLVCISPDYTCHSTPCVWHSTAFSILLLCVPFGTPLCRVQVDS